MKDMKSAAHKNYIPMKCTQKN